MRNLCSFVVQVLLRGQLSLLKCKVSYPPRISSSMSHLDKDKQKLVARIKRIRGQVDSIERSLTSDDDCADVLMLLANIRGGINSLMGEVLEDHIRPPSAFVGPRLRSTE